MNNSILKLILIGDGRVGKTSIINKYINNNFNENENMTTNVSYSEKVLVYHDKKYKFSIWDTAGQEKFNAVTPIYYRDAKGVVLVYDITSKKSFNRVKTWIEELKNFNEDAELIILGNKNDVVDDRVVQIDREETVRYAKEQGASHFFTSAKTGENLNEAFECIAEKVIKKFRKEDNISQKGIGRHKKITITKETNEENKNGWCC